MNIKIFVLYHDEDSFCQTKSIVDYNPDIFIPINTGQTKFFESNIYNILHNNKELYDDSDIICIIPYSIRSKMKTTPEAIIKFVKDNIEKYDVLPIYGNVFIKMRNNVIMPYIDACAKMHGSHTFVALYNVLSYYYNNNDIMSTKHIGFFCNALCMKKEVLEKYIEFFININKKIDKHDFLNEMLNRYSYYDGKLSKEQLLKISKFPYYTSHPFFYERLICLYMNLEKYKICNPLVQFAYHFQD